VGGKGGEKKVMTTNIYVCDEWSNERSLVLRGNIQYFKAFLIFQKGAGGEMTQALYAHMNNKTIKKKSKGRIFGI
jgi:hypothetical protein